jgi:ornithine carbamoyltransferase
MPPQPDASNAMERSSLLHRRPLPVTPLPPHHTALLLARARSLRQAARDGRVQPMLRGRRLALVCEADDGPDAQLFRRAGAELGAHVAHVRPGLDEHSPAAEVEHMARLLGRLYDAIECQGMPSALVQHVAEIAGVPVYEGVATPGHPTAPLAEQLEGDDLTTADKRRFVLQAALLDGVA